MQKSVKIAASKSLWRVRRHCLGKWQWVYAFCIILAGTILAASAEEVRLQQSSSMLVLGATSPLYQKEGIDDYLDAAEPRGASPQIEAADADEVASYLWQVYQRSSTKRDSHGNFAWKDVAAAARLGLSVRDYVIGGLDPDFREQLFAAGRVMDAARIKWTILSGYRDDYRQSLATGFRAQVGASFHGGSIVTGGYGHGCAIDIGSANGNSNDAIWTWMDEHGKQFGLERPMARLDPAHVQPRARWHELAAALRVQRSGRRQATSPTGFRLSSRSMKPLP